MQVKQQIKDRAKAYVDGLGIDDAELAREVQKRAELRATEWATHRDLFFDPTLPGAYQPGAWQTRGIDVAFNPNSNLTSPARVKVMKDVRKTRLTPTDADTPGRRAFKVEMEGPEPAREYRLITGDTDFLAILNADGTPLMDVTRRLEIYELLQSAVHMQHGESLTFALGAEKRAEFLRCCVEGGEAMVAIGPDGVPTAARFVETKSILDDTVNRIFRHDGAAGDFTLLFGARQQLKANTVLQNNLTLPDIFDILADAIARYAPYFAPGKLPIFVDGMRPDQTRSTFDRRQGAVLQPDGSGGLRIWRPGTAPAGGFPSVGGRRASATSPIASAGWSSVGLAQALSLGVPGTLDLLPQTVLSWSVEPGATRLPVATLADLDLQPDGEWFASGDRIVLDPGGPGEEMVTVTSAGPDSLVVTPVARDHGDGEMVSLVPGEEPPPLVVRRARATVDPDSRAVAAAFDARLPLAGQRLPACGTADWRLQVGLTAWTLPGSDQRRRRRKCLATTTRDGVTLAVRLAASGKLQLAIAAPHGISVENPLAVAFAAGDVSRNAEIPFRVRRRPARYGQGKGVFFRWGMSRRLLN